MSENRLFLFAALMCGLALAGVMGCRNTSPSGGSRSAGRSAGASTGAAATTADTPVGTGGSAAPGGEGAALRSDPTGLAPPIAVDAAPRVAKSGYLLISRERLLELKQKVKEDAPAWRALKANVAAVVGKPSNNRSSIENLALAYLLSGDRAYADTALAWTRELMRTADVQSGSYLYIGDILRPVAMTLNYLGNALPPAERRALADYLARHTQELWHNNQGSGWGLADPGNNYHMAFLEATVFAGYALREAGDGRGQALIDLAIDKLEGEGGVLAYLEARGQGGDWHEGANYGQRAKQRLYMALSAIASMGDKNYFTTRHFFADSIYYAIYQVQPGGMVQYPAGDLARDVRSPVSPYDRDYVQMATYWLADARARAYGQWYLTQVVPSYAHADFNWRGGYYKDVLFALNPDTDIPVADLAELPLFFVAPGTGWVHVRSGWDAGATSLSISAPAVIDQSHAHFDAGSFTLWKRDWQVADAVTYSRSGLLWQAGAHNTVTTGEHERRYGKVGAGLLKVEDTAELTYVQMDASAQMRKRAGGSDVALLAEHMREMVYLKPDTVIVYDRVSPATPGQYYDWRVHTAARPEKRGDVFVSQNGGGGMTVALLRGDKGEVLPDSDLESRSYRLQAQSKDGRFLAVLAVAEERPPALSAKLVSSSELEGAAFGEEVVLFRRGGAGQAMPAKVLTYTVPDTGPRAHTLVNMEGGWDVEVARKGRSTFVTLKPGTQHKASAKGVLRFHTK